jgi:hypothetical protein
MTGTGRGGAGRRHFERVDWSPRGEVDLGRWPFTLPAVALAAQLLPAPS